MDEFFSALVTILGDIVTEGRRAALALTIGVVGLVAFTLLVLRFASPPIVVPILAGSIGAAVIVVTGWAWWHYLRTR